MKNKVSGKHILHLLIFLLLFCYLSLPAQNTKTRMLVYKSGAVIFERDITEIDSVKFYQTNSATLSVPKEEMFVYRYGAIFFRKAITEIDSLTYLKTSEIMPLVLTGTLTPSVVQGCSVSVSSAAVTSVAELESLPGSLIINQGCSGKDKMTITHTDAVSGTCPITINRTYTIKDACNNTASVVHQITIEDTGKPVISGTLADITVQGSSLASVPLAASSVAALELLPGAITVNDNCTNKTNLTIGYTDEATGSCPVLVTRTYTIRDACENSVSTVQKITIQPNAPTIDVEYITGGTFTMGSPNNEVKWGSDGIDETQHLVTLSSFFMSKYEVSNAEFASFLNNKKIGADAIYHGGAFPDKKLLNYNASWFEPWGVYYSGSSWIPYSGFENYPVVFVTWYGAVEYANYVGGRLPTEAEWEYACRAGTTTPFNTGNCISDSQANYDWRFPYEGCLMNGTYNGWHTAPVNSYQPNAWGLYNMHGNVGEWCSDWYGPYPNNAQTNPTGNSSGPGHVVRGGGNSNVAHRLRSAFRYSYGPEYGSSIYGMRVVFPCTSFN